jgi:glycosyltransferase involved in cell wall biosynthesis
MKDLVSIIMLSRNNATYVEETVRSVMVQTYQNWEIVFMDDYSTDDTVSQMMVLMNECSHRNEDGTRVNKFHVTRSVQSRGAVVSMNSALQDAKG